MLTPARVRAARTQRPDAGFTLAELMVGMCLTLVIGTGGLIFFVNGTQQADRIGSQSQNAADVRLAAEQIAAELRLADTPTARPGFAVGRFTTITATQLVFYANLSTSSRTGLLARTPPTRVEVYVDTDGSLRQRLYRPLSASYPTDYLTNYPSTPSSSMILLRSVSNRTAVFAYCTAATDPTGTGGCTATTNPQAVSSVNITLTVARNGSAPQTVMTNAAITGAVS